MPIYVYKCEKCGAVLEGLYNIQDAVPDCPECKASARYMKRVWYPASYKIDGLKHERFR